jgi:glycosyltransferase involved in cell wall biosynthesis
MSVPRLTIGVPVYNGQKYIRFTLDSLLAQTFRDFEILVTDNCSTDSTPQIVAEYAARDPRVKYLKNETNLGPAKNYKVSMDAARGEFFKWNPADDVCEPTFLEKCIAVLDADPTVVLAHPLTYIIDSEGKVVDKNEYELDLDDECPPQRFLRMMKANHKLHGAHELYGVIRTKAIQKTPGMRTHVRGDSILLARITLLGRIRQVPEYLFLNRDHNDRSSKYLSRKVVRPNSRLSKYIGCGPLPSAEWWDPRLKGKIVFPEWRVLREYLRALQDNDTLTPGYRFGCYLAWARFAIGHIPKMGRDLVIGTEQFINKILGLTVPTETKPRVTT